MEILKESNTNFVKKVARNLLLLVFLLVIFQSIINLIQIGIGYSYQPSESDFFESNNTFTVIPQSSNISLENKNKHTLISYKASSPSSKRTAFTAATATTTSETVIQNRACLQHLLDNNVVEYYYTPEHDDISLNFSTRGIRTKKRLKHEHSKPSIVLVNEPSYTFDENLLPKNVCFPQLRYFMPNMMARDYDLLRNLLKFFKHVAALSGMEYYLNYGSLLGHIRFDKRPIPWDDDIDLSLNYSVIKWFEYSFKKERNFHFGNRTINKNFYPELYIGKEWSKIFDASQKKQSPSYPWTFPFIDLFYFRRKSDKSSNVNSVESTLVDGFNSEFVLSIPLSAAKPVKKEPFLGMQLFVPNDPKRILKLLGFNVDMCRSLGWSHRFERRMSANRHVDCVHLNGFYDFT